jgi:soluble lytic murein transglycosylase
VKLSLLLSALLVSGVWGVSLDEINTKPPSREKNFLIWQFLKQEINASEAREAFYQLENVNERFLFDYAAKTDEEEIRYTAECLQKVSTQLIDIPQDDCLYLALTPTKAQHLQSYEREQIANRLGDQFGDVQWLREMNHNNHFTPFSNVASSLKLFLIASLPYRHENFNRSLDDEVLIELTSLSGFDQLVYGSVTDPKMGLLQESLSRVSGGIYTPQTHFYLGINALKYGRSDNALFHLREAKNKAYSTMERDKNTFWLYRITQEQSLLQELSESLDINIYTLWAREKLGVDTQNYFTTLPTPKKGGFRGDDPFFVEHPPPRARSDPARKTLSNRRTV